MMDRTGVGVNGNSHGLNGRAWPDNIETVSMSLGAAAAAIFAGIRRIAQHTRATPAAVCVDGSTSQLTDYERRGLDWLMADLDGFNERADDGERWDGLS